LTHVAGFVLLRLGLLLLLIAVVLLLALVAALLMAVWLETAAAAVVDVLAPRRAAVRITVMMTTMVTMVIADERREARGGVHQRVAVDRLLREERTRVLVQLLLLQRTPRQRLPRLLRHCSAGRPRQRSLVVAVAAQVIGRR
jgi:hypothetical protein